MSFVLLRRNIENRQLGEKNERRNFIAFYKSDVSEHLQLIGLDSQHYIVPTYKPN